MFHSVASSNPYQCGAGAGKAKAQAHLELNLAKDMKGSKKGFCKCISREEWRSAAE